MADDHDVSKSGVWQYYHKIGGNEDQVQCSQCELKLVYKQGSTSSMKRHMQRRHDITVEPNAKWSKKKTETQDQQAQPKLGAFLASKSHLNNDSPKARKLNLKIAKMIYLDFQPYSVVEDEGFRETMKEAEPRYVIPTRKTFRYNIIPNLYNKAAIKLKQKIKAYQQKFGEHTLYSVTTDGWTSNNTASYIAYTLHITECSDSESATPPGTGICIGSYILGTLELTERHTIHNLKAHILHTLEKWGLFADSDNDNDNPDDEAQNPSLTIGVSIMILLLTAYI